MGSFSVGFGVADVVMPMVTGETWFRVPEVCRTNFVGKVPFGVGGKDVILHILGLFKRNTIAFQRAMEYGSPGLKELSMDARFAIANMTTELEAWVLASRLIKRLQHGSHAVSSQSIATVVSFSRPNQTLNMWM
jgi:homoaconitase/3-isopropylmalate dehydratase large subunit